MTDGSTRHLRDQIVVALDIGYFQSSDFGPHRDGPFCLMTRRNADGSGPSAPRSITRRRFTLTPPSKYCGIAAAQGSNDPEQLENHYSGDRDACRPKEI